MASRKARKWLTAALVAVAILVVAVLAGLHYAGVRLRAEIIAALGETSEIGSIDLGITAVTISDLRVKAPPGWPAEDTLRAGKIVVTPDWKALLSSRKIAVNRIHVDKSYLSVLRTPEGKLRLLPSLLEKEKSDGGPPPEVGIDTIEIADAAVDFYDASVRRPPFKVALDAVDVKLTKLHLPDLKGMSELDLSGKIKGPHHDGDISIKGELEVASKDSQLETRLKNVDLVAMQPYLIKAAHTGVKKGTLDVDVKSTVKARRLHAPGTVVLRGLELETGDTFLGLPRQAAVGALKDGKDNIEISFVLDGNLDDPKFSLNESMAMKFGAGLAETLGVSISSLGKSVGGAAGSIGSAIKGLFGN